MTKSEALQIVVDCCLEHDNISDTVLQAIAVLFRPSIAIDLFDNNPQLVSKIRRAANLTQQDIATATKVTQASISHWESSFSKPTPNRAAQYLHTCAVAIHDLISRNLSCNLDSETLEWLLDNFLANG